MGSWSGAGPRTSATEGSTHAGPRCSRSCSSSSAYAALTCAQCVHARACCASSLTAQVQPFLASSVRRKGGTLGPWGGGGKRCTRAEGWSRSCRARRREKRPARPGGRLLGVPQQVRDPAQSGGGGGARTFGALLRGSTAVMVGMVDGTGCSRTWKATTTATNMPAWFWTQGGRRTRPSRRRACTPIAVIVQCTNTSEPARVPLMGGGRAALPRRAHRLHPALTTRTLTRCLPPPTHNHVHADLRRGARQTAPGPTRPSPESPAPAPAPPHRRQAPRLPHRPLGLAPAGGAG